MQTRTVQAPRLHAALQQRNGGAPEPYDGIAELWFDDIEAFQHGRGDEAARQAARELLEDERQFIDLAASPMWVSEEWQVVAAPGEA